MIQSSTWRDVAPQLIEDAVSPELRDWILAFFEAHVPRPRSYQGIVDARLRQCDFVAITDPGITADIHKLTQSVSEIFGVSVNAIEDQAPLIYRYGVGVGFVTHHDEVTEVELARAKDNGQPVVRGDITVTVSLSDADSYAGGELYFVDPAVEFKPRAGSAVTFPATRRQLHGVRPITAGHRFALLLRFGVQDGEAETGTRAAASEEVEHSAA